MAFERLHDKHRSAGRLLKRHPWPAERPPCTCGHVDFNAQTFPFVHDKAQHFHVFVTEKLDVVAAIALHTIDRRDFQCANPSARILLHVPAKVLLVNCRAHPPPSGTGFCRAGGFQLGVRRECGSE